MVLRRKVASGRPAWQVRHCRTLTFRKTFVTITTSWLRETITSKYPKLVCSKFHWTIRQKFLFSAVLAHYARRKKGRRIGCKMELRGTGGSEPCFPCKTPYVPEFGSLNNQWGNRMKRWSLPKCTLYASIYARMKLLESRHGCGRWQLRFLFIAGKLHEKVSPRF